MLTCKRIFIGPSEVAGYYGRLASGMKELGVQCDFITFNEHPFEYGGETTLPLLVRIIRKLYRWRNRKANRALLSRLLVAGLKDIIAGIYLCLCIFRYDVFVFGFGTSLCRRNLDIPLLRAFGKIVVMNVAHGSELRPPFMNGACQAPDGSGQPTPSLLRALAREQKRMIARVERNVHVVVGAPLSSHYLGKKVINSFAIGLPCRLGPDGVPMSQLARRDSSMSGLVRIVHAPSHAAAKGTPLIRQAIQNLRVRGYRFEYIELQGLTNRDVLKALQHCDFVVDQAYSDTPLAGLGTEAAWYGKPAVVGGYGFAILEELVVQEMRPPALTCNPDDIEGAIERLIIDSDLRIRLGEQARDFVRTQWSAQRVAARYLRLILGDIPDDWWLDPWQIYYLSGAGQPEKRTRDNVRELVETYGVESLQLSHRPDLEEAFLKFADLGKGQDSRVVEGFPCRH
jgi:hypothetical protein